MKQRGRERKGKGKKGEKKRGVGQSYPPTTDQSPALIF